MANTVSQTIKQAIVNDLQALVQAGVLNSYIVDDGSKINIADYTFSGFPAAVVSGVNVPSSDYEDTATNLREYEWLILVVTTPENMPKNNPTYLEFLVDSVLGELDGDVTLQGSANGGVAATTLAPPGPVNSSTLTYSGFYVIIKAKQIVPAGVRQN
jgi:hypothetical protein